MLRAIISPAYYDAGCRPSADRDLGRDPSLETDRQTEPCHLDGGFCSGISSCRVCAACSRGAATPSGVCRSRTRQPQSTPRAANSSTSHQSLALALLLLWCLATSARASPVKRSWRDPCDLEEAAAAAAADGAGISEAKLLDQIISVNDVIRPKLDQHMDKFLELTYPSKDEAEMLRDWGQHNVSWLGFVRETMAAQEQQLSALSAAGALPTLFTDLQRLALGLEEASVVAAVTGNTDGMEIFRALQADLLQLLCELQLALLEKQLKPDSSKIAEGLSKDSPDLHETRERDLRNWVLVREYKAYIAHVHKLLRALRERSKDD